MIVMTHTTTPDAMSFRHGSQMLTLPLHRGYRSTIRDQYRRHRAWADRHDAHTFTLDTALYCIAVDAPGVSTRALDTR